MGKIREFISATADEIKAISWPPRKRVYYDSLIVLGALLVGGIIIAMIDYGFATGLKAVLTKIEQLNTR